METSITLRPGETFSLPLQGRGAAGYSWVHEASGVKDAVEVRIEGSGKPPHLADQPPNAGSVAERLVVKAISPGEVTVQLSQKRSWERDKPALAQHVLKIVVSI